jgi:D-3-phosphoglycerate dehydrogenase/glyoxylate/hydroxypyruvate reductase A
MAILVLPTSSFVAAQLEALRRLAPLEIILTDPDSAVPQDVEAILAYKLPPGLAARFPNLAFVASAGAGVDELVTQVPAHVPVTRAADPMQAMRMAQYVAMTVLRWHRELPRYEAQQHSREWQRAPAEPEERWIVGLMGYGALGRTVGASLRSLGYPVRAWTRTLHPSPDVALFAGPDALPAFLAGTRVLVCLLPLTPATQNLLDAATLDGLPQGAYLVNVSRGGVLDELALLRALSSGRLAGAALDVYSQEPLPAASPLWDEPRLLLTPHVAATLRPDFAVRQFLANLERARHGHPLEHVVDRARGY